MGILDRLLGGHHGGGRGHHGGGYGWGTPGVRDAIACPGCGAGNLLSNRFCPQCGTSLTPAQCAQCGGILQSGTKFCGQCGKAK